MNQPITGFLSDNVALAFEAPTGAGTSTINSAIYDMAGYENILFLVRLGTPAANNNVKAQQDTVVGFGGAADLAGTAVVSGANNFVLLDLQKPLEQFVRCTVVRGTSTTIDGIVVVRYNGRALPVAIPSTTSFEQWSSPAEGTA